jgi:hypothetical protein
LPLQSSARPCAQKSVSRTQEGPIAHDQACILSGPDVANLSHCFRKGVLHLTENASCR